MTSSEGEALLVEPQNGLGSEGSKAHLTASPAPGRDTFPWISLLQALSSLALLGIAASRLFQQTHQKLIDNC